MTFKLFFGWCGLTILLALSFGSVNSVHAGAVDVSEKSITIALTQEPPNLNSMEMTDLVSFFVISHVNEGLLRYDSKGQLIPGVAESWTHSDHQMIFELREDARWSNGETVLADDFVFAWRSIVNPASASPYATIFYVIKNAEAVHKGVRPMEELGVRSAGPNKLIVDLESPCGYCASLMVHGVFYPVNEKFFKSMGEDYGSEADHLLYNGPFRLTNWIHDTSMVLDKNEHYWNRDAIKLSKIRVGYITADNRARLNLFRDNQIALVRLGGETIKDALNQRLRLKTFVTGGMSYIQINMKDNRPGKHKLFRKALQMIIDPEAFTNKVISMPGYRPARSFFPSWLRGENRRFVSEHPPQKISLNEAKARVLIDDLRSAGALGSNSITLLTVASPTGAKIAEYFQGLIKDKMGLDVKVDQQSFKQYLDKARRGDFDLSISSWYPDFDDVVTYADLLASWNPNNRGGFSHGEYDRELRILQSSTDLNKRMTAAAKLQGIIIEEAPLIPLAETGSSYLQHPQLKGVIRRVVGPDPDYTQAWVKEN